MSELRPVSFRKPVQHAPRVEAPKRPATIVHWTPAEDAIIRERYPQGGKRACAEHLGVHRSGGSITQRAANLGVKYHGPAPNGRHRVVLPEGFDEALRELYQEGNGKRSGEVNAFADKWKVPRWWATHRAAKLGLVAMPHRKEPPWTAPELALLRRVPLHDLEKCAAIFREHGFTRSPISIQVKARRLQLSRRYNATLSATAVARILGVDVKTVTREILRGDLRAVKRLTRRLPQQGGDPWSIERADLRRYILDHLERVDLRKVDKFAFVEIVAGEPLEKQGKEARQ